MKAIFIFMFPFVFLYSSCSDNSFTELDTANVPVVEAYLKVGQPLSVKIRTVIPYGTSSTNVVDINTLTVTVTVDTITRQLLSVGGGNYVDSSLVIAENKEYELQVNYNGKMVTASTVVPTKPENFSQSASEITIPTFDFNSGTRPTFPDPVKLTWVNTDQTYYVVIIENMETSPIQVDESNNRPVRVFRNAPSQNSSYEIGAMQFQYLGKHRLILYHLHPEYAALFNENGENSLNLKEPATNIQNGLGIFTATNSDTLLLNVKK